MVPMLHRQHWSLYIINGTTSRVEILDPNPYGPVLGGTTWEDHHKTKVGTGQRKTSWCKLILKRLNAAIKSVRPRAKLFKWGNWQVGILTRRPVMQPMSNDCGFYVMKYLQTFDVGAGQIPSNFSVVSRQTVHILFISIVIITKWYSLLCIPLPFLGRQRAT